MEPKQKQQPARHTYELNAVFAPEHFGWLILLTYFRDDVAQFTITRHDEVLTTGVKMVQENAWLVQQGLSERQLSLIDLGDFSIDYHTDDLFD